MNTLTITRAVRQVPRLPILTPFYVLVIARTWCNELRGGASR